VSVLEHPTADQFVSMVGRALDRLAAHEIQKVVLARSVSVTTASPAIPYRVYHRFSQAEPSAFAFGRTSSTGAFIGASPELLVSRMGTRVLSEPLAGTVELDPADPAATDRTTALEASPKERSEHNLVVESVAGVLAAVCESLQVPDAPRIRRLSSLAHLATPISGHLSAGFAGTGALELAASLHPTPAVAGSPRDRALELIREREGDLRGLYAGPVGWMDARGDGEFAVAIRSVALRASLAYACAGAGIVAGSDPGRELAETAAKLRPALDALGIEHWQMPTAASSAPPPR
jgi:isochorismate synthase